MRLITTRIYRAFPELDRYNDERCIRFVRAARRGWVRRTIHAFLILVVGFASSAAVIGVWGLMEYLSSHLRPYGHLDRIVSILDWSLGVVSLTIGPLAAIVFRDILLRRRVRHILRARGVCANCRYGLIGLPINAANMVECPECATESEVDPALGELVVDELGKARYAPSEKHMPKPWFSDRAKRRMRRVGVVLAAFLIFGVPAIWGMYEYWLRVQAARASADRPGAAGLTKYVESLQSAPAIEGQLDAWEVFAKCQQIQLATESAFAPPPQAPTINTRAVYPDYTSVGIARASTGTADELYYQACEKLGREMLVHLREAGLFTQFRTLAACPRAVRPIALPGGAPSISLLVPELGRARAFARINAGRMGLAVEAGDAQEFGEALEASLALARIVAMQPTVMDLLVSVAIENLCLSRIRMVLASSPDAQWLDAIEGAMERQAFHLPPTHPWEGEYLADLDNIAWVFSDPANVRFGKYSPALSASVFSAASGSGFALNPGSLGTYEGNKAEIRALMNTVESAAMVPNWKRTVSVSMTNEESKYVLINLLWGAYGKAIASADQTDLERAGTRTLIALERSRLRTGHYPAFLAELVPLDIGQLPLDPWTGKPLGYRVVDPATDPHKRSFLLYGLGPDRVDDGGAPPKNAQDTYRMLTDPNLKGDFVINNPLR